MTRLLQLLAAVSLCAGVSACTTTAKMPLAKTGEQIDPGKPLYLMTVDIRNDYKSGWKPYPELVIVTEKDGGGKARSYNLLVDESAEPTRVTVGGPAVRYLMRLSPTSESTRLEQIQARATNLLVNGYFFAPLYLDLPTAGPGVHYLGNVNAVVRERQGEELRAGPVIPALDQSLTGASEGTFDVQVSDKYDEDMALFRKKFDALKNVTVDRRILPVWDREKAKSMADGNKGEGK